MARKAAKALAELTAEIIEGMPSRKEMASPSSRNAAKHRAWEIAKRETLREWKAARRAASLSTDLEEIRPE